MSRSHSLRICTFPLAAALYFALLPQVMLPANVYIQHNLVADTAGVADNTDPGMVNPWGLATSATSPFWVSDQRTGLSTIYNSAGVPSALKVAVPAAPGSSSTGRPTGIVANSSGFELAPGRASSFIFSTEDGTISGWNSAVDSTHAVIKVDNSSSGAVYKGLAIGAPPSGPMLYAANFYAGTIDVFDTNFKPVSLPGAFTDSLIPQGFAPFNIQNLGGKLYVTYAKQNAAKHDDVAGKGNGYVDVYDLSGAMLQRLIAAGPLNSPWGVAIASANFGDFSNDFLVGNFGDGVINAFNPSTGAFVAALQDKSGNPIVNSGLWALKVGNGGNGGDTDALYFAAGPGGQTHGLIGSIQAAPSIPANAVGNGASFQPGIAQNTWMSIVGANLASTNRIWKSSDFVGNKLPTSLDGVTVTVNGKPAYVYFVSPKQLNVLVPLDNTVGPVQVQTANNGLTSGTATVQMQTLSPAFFVFKNDKYVAATHSDNKSIVGPTTLYANVSTPAQPGEQIVMFGTGFGPTNPAIPDGQLVTAAGVLSPTPTITFGGVAAQVAFAGLTGAGLYQFNVTVPASTPNGDTPVVATIGGASTPAGTFITVQKPAQ